MQAMVAAQSCDAEGAFHVQGVEDLRASSPPKSKKICPKIFQTRRIFVVCVLSVVISQNPVLLAENSNVKIGFESDKLDEKPSFSLTDYVSLALSLALSLCSLSLSLSPSLSLSACILLPSLVFVCVAMYLSLFSTVWLITFSIILIFRHFRRVVLLVELLMVLDNTKKLRDTWSV